METFKSSNELEGDLRSGMEDIANNPLLTEMYNICKTYIEYIRQMHRISPGQFCSTERTLNFDQNVTYCENSKSKDISMFLAEFESIRTRVLKTNLKIYDQTRISSLQDKIVSSSVDNVSDSRERAPSSKDRHSVRDRRLQKRQKNRRIQKATEPSSIKKNYFSDLSLLASKVEMKTQPSNQYNFQFGKTGNLVDGIPTTKGSSAYNIHPSTSPKKRKYKVKVKVQVHRKKLKCEASLSPPPPPPPPPSKGPSVSNIHPPTSKFKYKAKIRRKKLKYEALPPPPPPPKCRSPPPPPPPKLSAPPPPKLPSPPPPPPLKLPLLPRPPPPKASLPAPTKLSPPPPESSPPSLPKLSSTSTKLPLLPSPSFPRLPLPPEAGYYQSSYPRSIVPTPPILHQNPALFSLPRPFIPDSLFGNLKTRSVTSFLPHSLETQTTSCHQLQQVLQTSQCNKDRMHDLQATEQNINIPGATHNYYPPFSNTPHTLVFHSNYPSTFNGYMHIMQQCPVMPFTNQLPNWNVENFKSYMLAE